MYEQFGVTACRVFIRQVQISHVRGLIVRPFDDELITGIFTCLCSGPGGKIGRLPGPAGQKLGIKEVDDGIWLVSFMQYDLGYFDLEQRTLQPLDNPFGPRLSPMS